MTLCVGKPGSGPKFKGGYGFSHIIAKHGESTAQKAIETIAKASECSIQGNDNTDATQYGLRVYFDGCTAILSKSPETNHWLLTAWYKKEETAVYATGEVRDSLGATAVTPTLNRRSGVNTTVSNHSIRQNAEESQEKVSARDSHGAELSKEQQEYFENSVVRDENGALRVVYHGTRKADFTVFKRNLNYYTDSEAVAESYAPNSEKFTGYLKIEKPFIVDAHGEKWSGITIDNDLREKLQEYGSSVFKENGKWKTSVADIASAIADMVDEGEADYDGVIIKNVDDTGSYYKGAQENVANDYITFSSNQFKNADNRTPTSDPDIRHSLRGGRLDELRYRPEMFAKWLLRKNGSDADVETVTEMVKKVIAADNKGGKTWDINSEIKKLETSK